MKKLLKNEHFRSFMRTLITELLFDVAVGGAITRILSAQDFSRPAMWGLGYAIFRTLIRVLGAYLKKGETLNGNIVRDNYSIKEEKAGTEP